MKRRLLIAGSALFLAACASGGTQGGTSRSRNTISAEEIGPVQVTTAFELVQNLRPGWLRSRGSASMSGAQLYPVVYVDNVRAGGLDMLHQVSKDVIDHITFLNGRDATTLYGTDHGGGAIMITTRR